MTVPRMTALNLNSLGRIASWRMPLEVIFLFCALVILSVIFDRSIAGSSVAFSHWIFLAMGDVISIYGPILLLIWALLRIWTRRGLHDAHRVAIVFTLLMVFVEKCLLVYSIASGSSNP